MLNNAINVPVTPVSVNTNTTQTQFLSMLNSTSSWFTLNNVNAQTGTTYTVQLSDYGKLITFSNAAAITVTLPQQSTTVTNAGFFCYLLNIGVAPVTLVIEGAETFMGSSGLATNQQCKIERYSSTNWYAFGNNGFVKIGQATTTAGTAVEFTNLNINYSCYQLEIDSLTSTSAGSSIRVRTSSNNGSTYDAGTTDYTVGITGNTFSNGNTSFASTGISSILIKIGFLPIAAGLGMGSQVIFYNPAKSSSMMVLTAKSASPSTTIQGFQATTGGVRDNIGVVNAIQLSPALGTFTGTFTLYGLT